MNKSYRWNSTIPVSPKRYTTLAEKLQAAPLPKSKLAKKSRKQAAKDREWAKAVAECKAERGDVCECGCGQPGPCEGHHIAGRGPGKNVKSNCKLLRHKCHMRIEDERELARQRGLSARRNGPLDLSHKYALADGGDK